MSEAYNPFSLPTTESRPEKPFKGRKAYSTKAGSKAAGANDEAKNHKGAFYGIDANGVAAEVVEAAPQIGKQEELPAMPESLPMYARRNDDGMYTWKGTQYPSVTTILGPYGGEGLMLWYGSMAVEDCVAQLDKADAGVITRKEADVAIRDIQARKTAAIRYRDFKGAIGTLTHHAIYERVLGISVPDMLEYLHGAADKFGLSHPAKDDRAGEPYGLTLAKAAIPYVHNAIKWLDKELPDFEAIGQEAVVVNPECGYAGTIDAIAKVRGRKYAIDFKTSKSIQELKFRMQVEAYRRASFIGLMEDGSEHAVPETDAVGILHIKPLDPCSLETFEPDDNLFEAFLSLRHVYAVVNGLKAAKRLARAESKPKKIDRNTCPFGQNVA